MKRIHVLATLLLFIASVGLARAAEPAACRKVRIANIGWTDNMVQNAVVSNLLRGLGYRPRIRLYSEEVTYAGLKNKQIDVFMDDWTPSMDSVTAPYVKSKAIEVIGPALTGAKYTLAVPTYLYDEGLKTFSDIHKFGPQLHYRIYGIEPGNDGNLHILKMIKTNDFDLGKFRLVQSSEQGMLAEVARKYKKKQAIVFLGWEPHPMNVEFKMSYLKGGAKYFGPNEGEATIYINTRAGYTRECPNVGRLLRQFRLNVDDESQMMLDIDVKKMKPAVVARAWLKQHPGWVEKTLKGVKTFSGAPGLPAVRKALEG